jgi:hypothetical protein
MNQVYQRVSDHPLSIVKALLLALLLFASQSVAEIHDTTHAFHEHDEVCKLFDAQSLPAHLVSDDTFSVAHTHWQYPPATTLVSRYVTTPVYFDAQAPPSLS